MLRRAIFISVVLHLVLVLSLTSPGLWLGEESGSTPTEKLNMFITERAEDPSPASSAPRIENAKKSSQMTTREADTPLVSRSGDLNFDHFLPSTVGMAKSGSDKHRSPVTAPPAESPSVSEAELGEYRLNVARSARQFKVYPVLAHEKGWEGVAHVAVSWPMGVAVPVVSLGKSSGYEPLDQQALEMIGRAIGQTRLPDNLRGKNLTISVPVEYRLAD